MMALAPKRDSQQILDYAALQKTLENYVYTVSHDLNGPLRHVREFTRLLLDKLDNRITEDERKYTQIIDQSVERLEAMLGGLLQLSRLNTRAAPFSDVDCRRAATAAWQSLVRQIEESGARIHIGPMPTVRGDEAQIQQLFYQLFDNAIKFHRQNTLPIIRLDATLQNDGWHFEVEDNGIGVDESQREEIFALFKRLHGDEIPGTGIGLTLCAHIAHRHGGWIACKPARTQGSIFTFVLPDTAADE